MSHFGWLGERLTAGDLCLPGSYFLCSSKESTKERRRRAARRLLVRRSQQGRFRCSPPERRGGRLLHLHGPCCSLLTRRAARRGYVHDHYHRNDTRAANGSGKGYCIRAPMASAVRRVSYAVPPPVARRVRSVRQGSCRRRGRPPQGGEQRSLPCRTRTNEGSSSRRRRLSLRTFFGRAKKVRPQRNTSRSNKRLKNKSAVRTPWQ